MFYHPFSSHGCEHVLTRVLTEQISWAKQGCAFVYNGWMPPMDPTLVPCEGDLRLPPRPEEREELDDGMGVGSPSATAAGQMGASFPAATRRHTAIASQEMHELSAPLLPI